MNTLYSGPLYFTGQVSTRVNEPENKIATTEKVVDKSEDEDSAVKSISTPSRVRFEVEPEEDKWLFCQARWVTFEFGGLS